MRFRDFLAPFKSHNQNAPHWGSLCGGLWKIPQDQKENFFLEWARNFPHYTEENHMGMVFRPPQTKLQPFLLDLDFKTRGEVTLDLQMCAGYARIIASKLQDELKHAITYIIVAKSQGYWCNLKKSNARL